MSNTASTQAAQKAALQMTAAIAEVIRELRQVPSGELYARVMGHMDLETYERIIGLLKKADLVSEKNHMLTWNLPEVTK